MPNMNEQWRFDWFDMPEFIQEEQTPYKELIIRFRDQASVEEFALLLEQTITVLTTSLWYPELDKKINLDKRWVDEESLSEAQKNIETTFNEEDSSF